MVGENAVVAFARVNVPAVVDATPMTGVTVNAGSAEVVVSVSTAPAVAVVKLGALVPLPISKV